MPIMRQDDSRVRMRCKQHIEKLAHICSLNRVMGRICRKPRTSMSGQLERGKARSSPYSATCNSDLCEGRFCVCVCSYELEMLAVVLLLQIIVNDI